jgi:hypothetical protein
VWLVLVAGPQLFIRWRRGVLDLPCLVLEVRVAYEFSVALGAGGALALRTILAKGVPLGIENSLAASGATQVYLQSHGWDGGYACRAARNATIGAGIATVRRGTA